MPNPFEKFFKHFNNRKNPEQEKIRFSLEASYGDRKTTQFFPNKIHPNPTINQLSSIKNEFLENFIVAYANNNPGTRVSKDDINFKIEIFNGASDTDIVDLI